MEPKQPNRERISRRCFLQNVAAASSLGALPIPWPRAQQSSPGSLPAPGESGIDHIVLVMMENRSFDHFLGWLPGANGRQAGLRYSDFTGQLQPTHHLTDFQGCAFQDPDHSYEGGRIEYDNGRCDGWLQVNDIYSIGYYEQSDLPFLGAAGSGWTVCDNYFAAILAGLIQTAFTNMPPRPTESTTAPLSRRCRPFGTDCRLPASVVNIISVTLRSRRCGAQST